MQFDDLESYSQPSRRPWLLIIVAIVGGVILARHFRGEKHQEEPLNVVDPVVEHVAPVAAPAAAREPAAVSRTVPAEPVQQVPLPESRVRELMNEAGRLQREDDFVAARELYYKALDGATDARLRREIEQRLGTVNIMLVTTPRMMPEKVEYVVQRGDFIQRIARRFGTTVELVQKSNRISNPNLIKAGDVLRVLQAEFTLKASKSRNDLIVFMDGRFFKRYLVGTGEFGRTPVGTFEIYDKIVEPVWWRPDGREVPFGHPENILGTRWMAIRATGDTPAVRGYGIHGTWDNSSIGRAESAGCIRMRNEEVEELFILVPNGTKVTIVD